MSLLNKWTDAFVIDHVLSHTFNVCVCHRLEGINCTKGILFKVSFIIFSSVILCECDAPALVTITTRTRIP